MVIPSAVPSSPTVAIYVVTYRRHGLLRRALRSVRDQTFGDWVCHVVNDDPDDAQVAQIVADQGDPRIRLLTPLKKRGPVGSFELVFQERQAPFAALLEDDNWWAPGYLASQLAVLAEHPRAPLVVGNARIWCEQPDGTWRRTDQTTQPVGAAWWRDPTLEGLCRHPVFANSAFVVRTADAGAFALPKGVPLDVSEHVRERMVTRPYPINGAPLAQYAQTLSTARSGGDLWGRWQVALIGSVFCALRAGMRASLAARLWQGVPDPLGPRAMGLMQTGLALPEARALVTQAPRVAQLRALAWVLRHPVQMIRLGQLRHRMGAQIDLLAGLPLVRALTQGGDMACTWPSLAPVPAE